MGTLAFALGVAALTFVAGLLGLALNTRLPESHSVDRSRAMIGAMTGLLGLLLALVLGTVIGASFTLYSTQKSEVETLGARTLQLDSALEVYGPETKPGREALRAALRQVYDEIWGDAVSAPQSDGDLKAMFAGVKALDQLMQSLAPKTDAQRQALATANAAASQINQTRLLMGLQLAGGLPWPMLTIVICWSALLFCGHGLSSGVNGTVIATLALGAITIASAVYLIIELSDPYSGTFKLPAAPVKATIEALGP